MNLALQIKLLHFNDALQLSITISLSDMPMFLFGTFRRVIMDNINFTFYINYVFNLREIEEVIKKFRHFLTLFKGFSTLILVTLPNKD